MIDKTLYYPIVVNPKITVEPNEVELLNKFFNTTKIIARNYQLTVWVEGKESDNWHEIIPVGKMVEISLCIKNTCKIHKSIEGVFDFELTDGDYNNQRTKILEWFFKHKTN